MPQFGYIEVEDYLVAPFYPSSIYIFKNKFKKFKSMLGYNREIKVKCWHGSHIYNNVYILDIETTEDGGTVERKNEYIVNLIQLESRYMYI